MNEQTDDDVRKEALAADASERIKKGQHWTDWMLIADGLMRGRAKAMFAAGTNKPKGKGYGKAMKEWMDTRPWARELDNPTRNDLFWCAEHRSEIEIWRDTLAQNERARLNHPTAMKRRYEASHRSKDDTNAAKKPTHKAALIARNAELEAELATLKRKMKDDGGSLFDLVKDPLPMIAKIMGEEMGLQRLTSAQREIAKEVARLKKLYNAKAC